MAPIFLQPPYRRPVIWAVALCCFALLLLAGFSRVSQLEAVQNQGALRVVILEDPRHINVGEDRFATALADAFARHLGVELSVQTVPDLNALLRSLDLGFADLAAGGLIAQAQSMQLRYSEPYISVQPLVVSLHNQAVDQDNWHQMNGVIRDSAPLEQVLDAALPERVRRVNGTTRDVLQTLADQQADYAIIDSSDYAFYRPYFPSLRSRFKLGDTRPIAWGVIGRQDESLLQAANKFLSSLAQTGELDIIRDRYVGHLQEFDYVGVRLFERHVRERLPPLRNLFENAAELNGIDWRLLAAQGYQESHWLANAMSPTGVRGIMMLTLPTAGELGVTNRLDPEQSIRGGAQYLASLSARVPEQITEPDRTWYALAAYNLGFGHVMDGRRIAEALDMNPDNWATMQDILPRLRNPDYYRFTRFGYARGDEAVIYVQNIRRYYDLLRWTFPTDEERDNAMPGLQPQFPNFSLPPLI